MVAEVLAIFQTFSQNAHDDSPTSTTELLCMLSQRLVVAGFPRMVLQETPALQCCFWMWTFSPLTTSKDIIVFSQKLHSPFNASLISSGGSSDISFTTPLLTCLCQQMSGTFVCASLFCFLNRVFFHKSNNRVDYPQVTVQNVVKISTVNSINGSILVRFIGACSQSSVWVVTGT